MKFFIYPLIISLAIISGIAQTNPAADDYFPSKSELNELHSVSSNDFFTDPKQLSSLSNGRLISDVGFQKYEMRTYSLGGSIELAIKIITLLDMQAAYSLLTLLRDSSSLQSGPPGDEYVTYANGIRFFQDNKLVEIKSHGSSEEFLKSVALSISNRIGQCRKKRPALISHLPKPGYNASSLNYFPGFKSFETYTHKLPAWIGSCGQDMEIAQAKYSMGNETGRLSLMSFPTREIAEECYSKLVTAESSKNISGIRVKAAGPIVGILEGPFDPGAAGKILDSIQYSYKVSWIYEKKAKSSTGGSGNTITILGTVVKSILFAILLSIFSIGAGFVFAVFRYRSRSRMSKNVLDNEITHLRMR
jgi:hypothetical protein